MIKVFEAFAGYGSQSIALRNLNIEHEVVAISEIDKYALQAYYSLHDKEIPNLGDISKIKVEDIPKHDLFTYSFPCTDISVAGKQEGIIKGQTRSGLLYECERIIEHCKPKYLLMENVKNLVGKKFKKQFDEWLDYLEGLGYTNYWEILNAKDYGIPQNRERVFVVSILGEHEPYKFPKSIKLDKVIKDILEDEVEEKYYLNKPWHFTSKNEQKHDVNEIAQLDNINYKATRSITDPNKICRTLDTMTGGQREPKILIPQATKKGYIEIDLDGVCDLSYPNSKTRRGRVQNRGTICPTLTAAKQEIVKIERTPLKFLNRNGKKTDGDYTFCIDTCHTGGIKEVYNDYFRIRKLTPRECFRLMGMNDNDIDKIQSTGISNTQQYKMAGNSIVVNVLEEIFRNLFIGEDKTKTPSKQ